MVTSFDIRTFFKEKFGLKDENSDLQYNRKKNQNSRTTRRNNYREDSIIFAYTSMRAEDLSYPVHFFVNNSNNSNIRDNRLAPTSEYDAIIANNDESAEILLDSEFINSMDSLDDVSNLEAFDSNAFKRIMEPLEILEEYFHKPRTFSITTTGTNENLFLVKVPVEIVKNCAMNYCSKHLKRLISSSFYELKSLTTLQLCCNSLTELPAEICLLRQLETLSLSNNKLKFIPSTIGYLTNLENLYLDRNELTTLPRSISGLKKLKILSLAANRFKEIPRSVMLLNKLITLECDRNPQLIGVPSEIARFSQLSRFHVEECPRLLKPEEYERFQRERMSYGTPSLMECSARSLIRHRRPVINSLPRHLRLFISKSEECSFCSGPMIESRAAHCRTIKRIDRPFPVIEQLCCTHWQTEEERIQQIFSPAPQTTPPHLIGADRRNRTGHLAPFNQFDPERLSKGKRILSKFDREDIGNVLVPLSLIVDWPQYPTCK